MKFDVVVGNPPYQEDNAGNNRNSPIYQNFYNLAEKISSIYCLISPARFLFNAGQTPKDWNEKMLNNEHLKVVYFNQNSSEVFVNTDIKGGIAVLYHDKNEVFGSIDTFARFEELQNIMVKVVNSKNFISLNQILYLRSSYKFTDKLLEENPNLTGRAKGNEAKSMGSNVFDRYPEIFFDSPHHHEQVQIYGRQNNARIYKYVNASYIQHGGNLEGWKVFVTKSNGAGALGEVLSTPEIGEPNIGHTQTFISIGNFEHKNQATALLKYLKCKFTRAMLGIKKITQDNATKETWSKVPLQDFSPNSDIDWSKPIAEIDQQLYKKYGLSAAEIEFIETKVKAMD
ncbi:Eco57I restriction-modification methylase domain-containing protein [Providencia vermicola]|uniref:Eco57I restriction-modification methylase domain-containing protein n=1 Tax=Providencia vermicola TaxID=333965 RepID=UPI002928A25E|nr:Eco57I restriction-modification methylase domain-containing protein [Providencia rettgeri]